MDYQIPVDRVIRLAVHWPACDAKTVHVAFAESNWETPGVELQRQPDGEYMCFLGEQKPFEEIFFKFIIDGTIWEVNRSIPVVFDKYGYENNRWTLKEATEYYDSCIRVLTRRVTLASINWAELCGLALSIHGETDKDGCQLECVVDESGFNHDNEFSIKLPMSGSLSEVVFLRFQPLGKQLDLEKQDNPTENEVSISDKVVDEYVNKADEKQEENADTKDGNVGDSWIAKFPANLDYKMLPYQMPSIYKSNSEKERLMESECATLRFLNEYTGVAVPQIYAYDVRYKTPSDFKPVPETGWSNLYTNGLEKITENKVGWPFILLGGPESMALTPYWLHLGNLWKKTFSGFGHLEQMMLHQMVMYRIELAKHPLAACGYLTLDKPYWQQKNESKSRKTKTPKAAFGIRPCIYDACEPFTNSIVAAFEDHPRQRLFPPARAFNSLNSVTARFQHFLTHGRIGEREHFVALWQLQALLYELFGSQYENGPFILQYPNLLPNNISILGGLIGWEGATVVPIQVAACIPRVLLSQFHYNSNDLDIIDGLAQPSLAETPGEYQTECNDNTRLEEVHMNSEEHIMTAWEDTDSEGKELFLSQVIKEKMLLPMLYLDELCSGFISPSLVGKVAVRYFPLIYKMVKGYSWDAVREAVINKGAMRFFLQDWEEEQIVEHAEPINFGHEINTAVDNDGLVP